ncbi:MAG: MFS transporter [Myxococcales bacterium]|nr:MFS transporter [Myxococcales bacterium]
MNTLRTTPDQENTGWPPGVPYIVGNEACERFSFYGMRAILFVHLSALYVLAGQVQERADDLATGDLHFFKASVYLVPMLGAVLADRFLGKFKVIFWLSLVYCAGHAVLAVADDTLMGMYLGLGLIAVGSGGIKPCVSANVGDQFGKNNWFRVRSVFQIFYFSINFGSFGATLLIPTLKEHYGASVAFAIPGILMFVATIIFWLGRNKFVHVPAKPSGRLGLLDAVSSGLLFIALAHFFVTAKVLHWSWPALLAFSSACFASGLALFFYRQRLERDDGFLAVMLWTLMRQLRGGGTDPQNLDPHVDPTAQTLIARGGFFAPAVERFGQPAVDGTVAVLKVATIFFPMVPIFWSLFDQHSSSWIRQSKMMDLTVWEGFTFNPSQVPALNPALVMIFIPLMNVVYRGLDHAGLKTTPLRRMTVGMFLASVSFVAVAFVQQRIDGAPPNTVTIWWQVLPYVLITVAEVLVSITGLEFAYTQAPRRMKSTIMGLWLLAVATGNILTGLVAQFGGLSLVNFFWLFAGLMAAAAVLFGVRSLFFVARDFAQE